MWYGGGTEDRQNTAAYIFMLILLAAGVTAGSVYLVRGWSDMGEGISGYLSGFFENIAGTQSGMAVFKTSLVSNLVTLVIIFIMGFFRFGFIGTGALILRRGFIMGFTSASFLRSYGARGIVIMLSTMPAALIYVPALIIFSAVSVTFSMQKNKFQKKFIFSYIFFAIFMISIFCAASLSEGFLTTTFMKLISPKLY